MSAAPAASNPDPKGSDEGNKGCENRLEKKCGYASGNKVKTEEQQGYMPHSLTSHSKVNSGSKSRQRTLYQGDNV